ncbi:acyl-CoA synthetase FdrA [Sesbania bispinosa]|nr:acyl-CoA synthetase FdrA [Sesbania bispinosa]
MPPSFSLVVVIVQPPPPPTVSNHILASMCDALRDCAVAALGHHMGKRADLFWTSKEPRRRQR